MADDMGSMTGELEQPYILITDQRLADNFKDVVPVLEEVMQSGHPLLIVADDVRGESLNSLLMNRQKGTLISAAVMCPGAEGAPQGRAGGHGHPHRRRRGHLPPSAVCRWPMPRRACSAAPASVQITKSRTLIIGGKGKQEAIEKRCEAIRNELKTPHSDYELDVMRERLAKLSGGIAVMSVGAATETEMNEIRSRIQDALRATRSAASQGLLAGGGVALIQASKALDQVEVANEEERFGVDILRKALEEPCARCAATLATTATWRLPRRLRRSPVSAWIARPASTAT